MPMRVTLTNGGTDSPEQMSKWLYQLADFLEDEGAGAFECTCVREGGDYGTYESDTNAYTHADNCPTNMQDSAGIILRSSAAFFAAHDCKLVAAGDAAIEKMARDKRDERCMQYHKRSWEVKTSTKSMWRTNSYTCTECGRTWKVRSPIK